MIEVSNLSKYYRNGPIEVKALQSVSIMIGDGEYVSIMGPSGSGKSTLMNLLGCLDTPSSGSYKLDGQEISALTLSKAVKVSGYAPERLDRVLVKAIKEGLILASGTKRNRAYQITDKGLEIAWLKAAKLAK